MDIVPQGSVLIVEAQIPCLTDIDKVSAGLEVILDFLHFIYNKPIGPHGKVIHVSADSFVDEATGNSYYGSKSRKVYTEGQKTVKRVWIWG